MKRVSRLIAVAVLMASTAGVATPAPTAMAGSGFNQWRWGDAGITLSSRSYRYSNMTGFWQAVLNSSNCPVAVDGNYGNNTLWYTAVFQNGIVGYNNGRVMTPSILNLFFVASSVYGQRLVYFYTNGYGTQHFGYYGGYSGSDEVQIGWNVFSSQWYFSQYPISNPVSVVAATPNRTIGSVSACS